jgi:hypothetical protein
LDHRSAPPSLPSLMMCRTCRRFTAEGQEP